jgi:hypothetical protein
MPQKIRASAPVASPQSQKKNIYEFRLRSRDLAFAQGFGRILLRRASIHVGTIGCRILVIGELNTACRMAILANGESRGSGRIESDVGGTAMKRAFWLRVLAVAAVSAALAGTPESSFAQHGGHAGGGGFHGGGFGGHAGGGFHGGGGFGSFHGSGFQNGGFGSFRGGQGFSGFRNRGFGGFRNGTFGFRNGGFGGFRGGRGFGGFRGDRFFRGFRRDRDFFFDFDFGFWPYWDAYPYWYGYGPGWGPYTYYSPYDYPDYPYDAPPYRYPRDDRDNRCRPDYRHPDNGCSDGSPDTSRPIRENPPAKPSHTLGPESSPERNYVTTNFAHYRTAVSHSDSNSNSNSNDRATQPTIAATTAIASDYERGSSTAQHLIAQHPSAMRPAVRNAMEALSAMPPDARERQLNSGRYDAFSPEERELLNNASQPAQAE